MDALASTDWELAFKRTQIRLNSADSGPGSLLLVRVADTTFDSAPVPGRDAVWLTDDFVNESCEVLTVGRSDLATAMGVWYDYDPATRSVSAPDGVVYFVYNSTTRAARKLQIEDYTSAMYTIRTAPVGR